MKLYQIRSYALGNSFLKLWIECQSTLFFKGIYILCIQLSHVRGCLGPFTEKEYWETQQNHLSSWCTFVFVCFYTIIVTLKSAIWNVFYSKSGDSLLLSDYTPLLTHNSVGLSQDHDP